MTNLAKLPRFGALALLSFPLLGCGSGADSDDSSDDDSKESDDDDSGGGTAGTPDSLNWVTVSGGDVGSDLVSYTIEGSDYSGGNGIQCYLDPSFTPVNLRIDARGGDSDGDATLLLQYWNFSTYEMERDESFDPAPPQAETFRLSADASSGDEFFYFRGLAETSAHLASGATCHTSFSRIDSVVAGKMVCENLSNDFANANVTIQFSCEAQTY